MTENIQQKRTRSFVKLSAFLLFTSISSFCYSQAGEWTWMRGTPYPFGSSGVWGTQGVADAANDPPAVYEACEWKDENDNLWVFGGINNSSIIYYCTLWKYDITTNEWTWISGPGIPDQPGVYGTQGVPSPSNYPGARGWGELSWTDSSGHFWLFGGYGYDESGNIGCLGDLWMYDVSTNEWTWVDGSSSINYNGSYGTQGVADPSNAPPSRQETSCAWNDSANNLWMFGGWSQLGQLNDLWKYEITTNTWTWMSGSNFANQYGNYGTMGVAAASNVPGGRAAYARWRDKENNLWLYGGNGYGSSGNGFLSDLWKYDISTDEWTWVSGSGLIFELGIYGSKCDFSGVHYPSNKYETRAVWQDDCGYFFLYGGTSFNGHEGDLWVYDYVANKWAWISGDTLTNTSAVSGTQGVSSSLNKPGLRTGADSWIDQSGNLWLFGGNVCSNDIWRFVPDYDCIGNALCSLTPQSNFAANDSALCEKFCINFSDQSTNDPTSWQWTFPGGNPSTSTDQNPVNICYDFPGSYDVVLITSNSYGIDTLTLTNFITVYPTPPFPVITQSGYTLTSSAASTYQWQFNSVDIPGADNQSYDAQQSGYYSVFITDENGCGSSATVYVLIEGVSEVNGSVDFSLYPNPSDGSFVVEMSGLPQEENRIATVRFFNALGQVIFYSKELRFDGNKIGISVNDAGPGIYFIEVTSKDFFARKKLIIDK